LKIQTDSLSSQIHSNHTVFLCLTPIHVTYDLDNWYSRPPASVRKLFLGLIPIHPRLRGAPDDLLFRFDEKTIVAGLNFVGDLDLLGEVKGIWAYEDVLKLSIKNETYASHATLFPSPG